MEIPAASHDILDEQVRKGAEEYGLQVQVIACDPDFADTAAFCEHYGFEPSQSANTILVATKTDPIKYAACLVLATSKLDVNKKVCKLLEVRKASFASAEQTQTLTNMIIGGVTVVGLPEELPIYIDAAVMEQSEVVIGGGNRTSKIVLSPEELKKLPAVEIIEALSKRPV